MDQDCIFCKIVQGDIPCFKIYEDADYLAFLDVFPFVKGHTLVIPKKHISSVWDVEDSQYFTTAQKIANHYKKLGYKFVDSMSFGRGVPHAHIHLLPHNKDEESAHYAEAIAKLDDLAEDPQQRPTVEQGNELVAKLKL